MKSFFKKIITSILIFESRIILKKYHPYIIAVTGSVGKTSTKDAIYSVMSRTSMYVRKSEKSFNSEIGVQLTIIGCKNAWNDPIAWIKNILLGLEIIIFKTKYPNCLILELGADHPDDMKNLCKWLHPDIAVFTKISNIPVHVEFFPSPEAVFKEKAYLARAIKKDGIFIFQSGDDRLLNFAKEINKKYYIFGLDQVSNISASNDHIVYEERDGFRFPIGMNFKLDYEGNSLPVNVNGVLGSQHIYPLLASTIVGIVKKIPLIDIVNSLNNHIPPRGRMNILNGIKDSIIIDDTYNSSPDALSEALITMKRIETIGRKIAVIGDMMELGKFSSEEHKKAGVLAHEVASIVITVGQRAKMIGGNIISFDSIMEASEYVRGIIEKGDIVLVKGSQSMRMEKIVKDLLEEPYKAGELLVRQDVEWLAKK